MQHKQLYRQGDVLFSRISALPAGTAVKRKDGAAAYGEVTGHSHSLAAEHRATAEVLEIEGNLFVHVSADGVHIKGATFVHEEHGPITLPPGDYAITIQREYSPEEIRSVAD